MNEPNKGASGYSDILVWLLVAFCLVVTVLVSIPNYVHSGGSVGNACINNLRQIDAAANQFALEHSLTNGDYINFPNDLTPYLKLNREGKISPCPSGGIYHISKVGEMPTCSLGSTVTPPHVLP